MKLFLFLNALQIPITVHGAISRKYCISEIKKTCHEEMKEKSAVFNSIHSSIFPPSFSTIRNFTGKCENVLKCASKLNCVQKRSQKEITGAICENVGVEYYFYEHQCMVPFTREVYRDEHNCAEDFEAVLRTPSMVEHALKNQTSCISKVLLKTCKQEFIELLRKNPVELLGPYFKIQNLNSITNDCTSPSDKLEKMRCDGLGLGLEYRLKEIPVLNASDSDVKEAMDMCRRIEKCQKDACLTSGVLKQVIKANCDYIGMMSGELKSIFELHPEYSRCECLKRMSYLDVFNAYK